MSESKYPAKAGHSDADTSKAAADAYDAHLRPMQRLCLAVIRKAGDEGLTADEVRDALGLQYKRISPRLAELEKMRLIRDSGEP